MANKTKERQVIKECIRLYRDLPALWDVKSKMYYDRDKKNVAYDILVAKYKELFPDATKDEVKKKFNSLRTNYRKELKKYVNAMQSGSSYEPSLWYFEEMSFLNDPLDYEFDSSMNSSQNPIVYEYEEQESRTSTMDEYEESTHYRETFSSPPSKKQKLSLKEQPRLEYERHEDKDDEYYHWAMACAADLRKMERTQQLYAKKAIAEVIMEGHLGLLHRNSLKINETQPSPSPSCSTTIVKEDDYIH